MSLAAAAAASRVEKAQHRIDQPARLHRDARGGEARDETVRAHDLGNRGLQHTVVGDHLRSVDQAPEGVQRRIDFPWGNDIFGDAVGFQHPRLMGLSPAAPSGRPAAVAYGPVFIGVTTASADRPVAVL
jgi:hypothetical protein